MGRTNAKRSFDGQKEFGKCISTGNISNTIWSFTEEAIHSVTEKIDQTTVRYVLTEFKPEPRKEN